MMIRNPQKMSLPEFLRSKRTHQELMAALNKGFAIFDYPQMQVAYLMNNYTPWTFLGVSSADLEKLFEEANRPTK